MKSKLQKILSVFLSLALVFGVLPGSLPVANAADSSAAEGTPQNQAEEWKLVEPTDTWYSEIKKNFYGGVGTIALEKTSGDNDTLKVSGINPFLVRRAATDGNSGTGGFVSFNIGVGIEAPKSIGDLSQAQVCRLLPGETTESWKAYNAFMDQMCLDGDKFYDGHYRSDWVSIKDSDIKTALKETDGIIKVTYKFRDSASDTDVKTFYVNIDVNDLTVADKVTGTPNDNVKPKDEGSALGAWLGDGKTFEFDDTEDKTFLKITGGKIEVENGVNFPRVIDSEGKVPTITVANGAELKSDDLAGLIAANGKTVYDIKWTPTGGSERQYWKYEDKGKIEGSFAWGSNASSIINTSGTHENVEVLFTSKDADNKKIYGESAKGKVNVNVGYKVDCSGITNGTVTAKSGGSENTDKHTEWENSALKDEAVTLTVTPEAGYVIKPAETDGKYEVKATYTDGTEEKELDLNGSVDTNGVGTFTFTMPGADVTVSAEFAKECKVTFDMGGVTPGAEVKDQTVVNGAKVTKPTDPTATGLTFAGWYTDENYATEFDFANTEITKDTTVYAMWLVKVEYKAAGISLLTFMFMNNYAAITKSKISVTLPQQSKKSAQNPP